jgi:D-inositol-3-phosphate glycosyltransferase
VVGATHDELGLIRRLYGVTPRQFAVIPPGVDLDRYRPYERRVARAKLGIGARTIALFVGRLDRIKGLDSLFRIVAERPERFRESFELVIAGGAQQDDQATRRYRHLAETLHIDTCVRFVGSVDAEVLPLYYSAADVCVLPSAHESFGIVALESMACETPVVAYRVGGPSTTIIDGQTGFLATPGSSSDYARALWYALDSPDLLHMGRMARSSVHAYAWDTIADRTEELYRQLLASRARTTRYVNIPPPSRRCLGVQPLSNCCPMGAWKRHE